LILRLLRLPKAVTKTVIGLLESGSEIFHARIVLNDALMESYPDSRFSQFVLAPEPLWAWLYSV
jgi:hypothetical protein